MNEGKCIEALVIYNQLVRNAPKGIRVREALEVRVATLTTKLEKLARELRHSVPDSPDPMMVVAMLETALTELKAEFPDEYLQTSKGVLAAKDNEQFIALVSEDSRTRLLDAAQAIVDRFEEAHIRRDEYRSQVQREKVTLALAPVFERARNYEVRGDHKKALAAYRRLKNEYPTRDSLSQRFEERVEFYSTLIRYLEIIERATAQGNYRVARNQYRALKQQYPAQKFPNLRLPVWVETTPPNARVYLNGTEMGTSPIKLAYSPVSQTTIRVELDGFKPEEARLVDDANDRVVSLLSRIPDWTIQLPGSLEHQPVADSEGRVFFADRSGTVTAVDSNTGKVIWTYKTRDLSGLHPRPLIYGDRLIVASIDGTLRSLDLQTGRLDWSREGIPSEIAPVACGSTVVLVTTKNKLVGLHPGAAKINYSEQLRGRIRAAPVAIAHHVFTVTVSGRVVKFVGSNGKRAWFEPRTVGQIILAQPIPTPRGLLFPGGDGSLTLLNPQGGQELWRLTGLGDLSAPVMVENDTVFLAQEREVAARSLADGDLIASLESQTEWTSPPALLAGNLLVGNRDGQVRVFDSKTLKQLYQIRAKGRIVAAPVLVSRRVLVVASETGRVLGFTKFP
jgi:outer membrane protein assembly factor BamB